MATSTSSTTRSSKRGALVTTLPGVIAGIKLNLPANKTITLGNASTTGPAIASTFQAYLDKSDAADSAKQAATQAVAARKDIEATTQAELRQFTTWAVGVYGVAAYTMFNLTPPKQHSVSPTKKAIGIAKLKATLKAKKAALASIAPAEESLVALDAMGNPIGGAPSAAVPAPTAASAAPAAK